MIPVQFLVEFGHCGLSFCIGIMLVNALVHTAVVTDMAEEVFHDAMEGLGILASLPPQPGP